MQSIKGFFFWVGGCCSDHDSESHKGKSVDTMYAVDQFVTVNRPKTEDQQIATGKQPINGQ
jgi:hypothetical protein